VKKLLVNSPGKKTKTVKNHPLDSTFALVGNPNVGKSVIFNQLTGLGVSTANYPGTTVVINEGQTIFKGKKIKIVDLPGAYSLNGITEDQWVTRQAILEKKPDCIIAIADATNLERNLYMVFQLIDMNMPIILGLNLIDLAESKRIKTDIKMLERLTGIPIVPVVAIQGKGLDSLIETALHKKSTSRKYSYGSDIEVLVQKLTDELVKCGNLPYDLQPKAAAFMLMENDDHLLKKIIPLPNGKIVQRTLKEIDKTTLKTHGQSLNTRLAVERYGLAGKITAESQRQETKKEGIADKLWRLSTHPVIGIITLLFFITFFFTIVIGSGLLLSNLFTKIWSAVFSPSIKTVVYFIFQKNEFSKILLWGVDDGVSAALSIGIAFILPFYLLFSILEDSGYLNSIAFLADRLAHRIGLHGRSIIPLISAAGCNVPAIMGTRALGNKREKFIASTLISMVPCSARTAVILGSVALFAGLDKALLIYVITITVVFSVGFSLNKVVPGNSTGLVMELFPFRLPSFKNCAKKTWVHLKGFMQQAFPYIIIGSFIMGILLETGYLNIMSQPISFLTVTILGLPAITGVVLLAGFLRKEMALELLIVLAAAKFGAGFKLPDLMTDKQMFIFALVVALYIPCIATFSILGKELGWPKAIFIAVFTTAIAFTVGGLFNLGFHFI
jgi:ferrous iron transport protein B